MGDRAGFGVFLLTNSLTGCPPALCPPCPLNLQGGSAPWAGKGCGGGGMDGALGGSWGYRG